MLTCHLYGWNQSPLHFHARETPDNHLRSKIKVVLKCRSSGRPSSNLSRSSSSGGGLSHVAMEAGGGIECMDYSQKQQNIAIALSDGRCAILRTGLFVSSNCWSLDRFSFLITQVYLPHLAWHGMAWHGKICVHIVLFAIYDNQQYNIQLYHSKFSCHFWNIRAAHLATWYRHWWDKYAHQRLYQ